MNKYSISKIINYRLQGTRKLTATEIYYLSHLKPASFCFSQWVELMVSNKSKIDDPA